VLGLIDELDREGYGPVHVAKMIRLRDDACGQSNDAHSRARNSNSKKRTR
jgi:hypothetical protein